MFLVMHTTLLTSCSMNCDKMREILVSHDILQFVETASDQLDSGDEKDWEVDTT